MKATMIRAFTSRRFVASSLAVLIAACSSTDQAATNHGAGGAAGELAGGRAGESDDPPTQPAPGDGESGAAGARTSTSIGQGGESGESESGEPESGAAGTPNRVDDGEPGGANNGGSAGKAGDAAGSTSSAGGKGAPVDPNEGLMIPCDVYAAYASCRVCHNIPPLAGAPFPLLTLDDLQAQAASEYADVTTGVMPLGASLPERDKTTILAWLHSGARGVPKADCP